MAGSVTKNLLQDYWGDYGGCFVSETLVPALRELKSLFLRLHSDPTFVRGIK